MSHLKVRYLVALLAAATLTSASTAQAETKKKQAFADLLTSSLSTVTADTASAYSITAASVATRASSSASGITARTVRPPGTTFAEYRRLVYREFFVNRFAFFSAYRRDIGNFAAQQHDLQTFFAIRSGLLSEYRTGIPVPSLTQIRY